MRARRETGESFCADSSAAVLAVETKMRFPLLADFMTAVGFLTLAPAPGGGGLDRLARAAGFFPVVGAFVGAAGGAAAALALWAGFGQWLAAAFAVAVQVVLTGGLHEDGVADFADGLGGRDRAARLAAMRDGAVGAWAVLALGGVMVFRVGALAGILALGGAAAGLAALVATGALSRAAVAGAMRWTRRARADGLAASAGRPPRGALALAGLSAAVCAAPLGVAGAAAFAAAAGGAAAVCGLAARRLGGATGDVFGAVQAVAETAALCALVAATGA